MSHFISHAASSLMVRDAQGNYQIASADQVLEAARALVDMKLSRGAPLSRPESVQEFLTAKLAGLEHEVFGMLLLDTQLRLITYVELFRGTIDSTTVYPREVVKAVLANNAAAVILAHNHPSGSTTPSQADQALTQRLTDALRLVDVRTVDHIIVAGTATVSFAALGLL